jgi:Tfp pilus assembly protein PilZ
LKIDKERRGDQRFRYEALVSLDVPPKNDTHTGKMFNFCKGGLYFESDQSLYPGQDILVGLEIHPDAPGKNTQLVFEVKILWHKQLGDSPFRYGFGGKFLNSIDSSNSLPETGQIKKPAEQEALQSDFSSDNDSRKQNRRPYNKFLHFSYSNNDYKQVVANIGRGGAFISTKEKFVLGGRLTLIVPGSQRRKELKVTGWIVRTSPDGIGVSFERRTGRERRSDLDRRTGSERRRRKKRKN